MSHVGRYRKSYSSPEAAARKDVPSHLTKVLTSRIQERYAVVVIRENEAPNLHHALIFLQKVHDGWVEIGSTGSIGELDEQELWVEVVDPASKQNRRLGAFVGLAPHDARRVRVQQTDEVIDTFDGHYLLVNWDAESNDWALPDVTSEI